MIWYKMTSLYVSICGKNIFARFLFCIFIGKPLPAFLMFRFIVCVCAMHCFIKCLLPKIIFPNMVIIKNLVCSSWLSDTELIDCLNNCDSEYFANVLVFIFVFVFEFTAFLVSGVNFEWIQNYSLGCSYLKNIWSLYMMNLLIIHICCQSLTKRLSDLDYSQYRRKFTGGKIQRRRVLSIEELPILKTSALFLCYDVLSLVSWRS